MIAVALGCGSHTALQNHHFRAQNVTPIAATEREGACGMARQPALESSARDERKKAWPVEATRHRSVVGAPLMAVLGRIQSRCHLRMDSGGAPSNHVC